MKIPLLASLFIASARLLSGQNAITTLAVELHADAEAPTIIRAGAFARHNDLFVLPADVSGRVILEVSSHGSTPTRAVILARNKEAVRPINLSEPPVVVVSVAAAFSSIDRTFWSHFGANEAIYFVYGAEAPAAKFQLSFKYRLRSFGKGDREHALRTLQFASCEFFYTRELICADAQSG